jgi:hypothetical protein
MITNSEHVINWRQRTKQRMIESFGGKCGICGYNNFIGALEFHHLISDDKESSLAGMIVNPASWHKIVYELRKCVCLCSICHREVHGKVKKIPDNIQRFNELFSEYKLAYKKEMDVCPICGREKWARQKTCSLECAAKKARTVNWDSVNLYDLWIVKKITQTEIANSLGCSNSAVRKRLKKLQLL